MEIEQAKILIMILVGVGDILFFYLGYLYAKIKFKEVVNK